MDIHSIIGIKIKNRRKELGLSGADLANKLKLSQQQISRYENGVNKIPINHLIDIADVLKCPIEWFFKDYKNEALYSKSKGVNDIDQEFEYVAESVVITSKNYS